jgi:hypothetical protein
VRHGISDTEGRRRRREVAGHDCGGGGAEGKWRCGDGFSVKRKRREAAAVRRGRRGMATASAWRGGGGRWRWCGVEG